MSLRDFELLEAIRRDDLAYVLTTRYEKPLEGLLSDDTPNLFLQFPSPMMVAAYFGSIKCFEFFTHTGKVDYLDAFVLFFFFIYKIPFYFFIVIASISQLLEET